MLECSRSCNVSSHTELGLSALHKGHKRLVHRDAANAAWAEYPSRRGVAYGIVIVLSLLSFAPVAGMHGHNWWALLGVAGAATAGKEVADELAERRYYRRGGQT